MKTEIRKELEEIKAKIDQVGDIRKQLHERQHKLMLEIRDKEVNEKVFSEKELYDFAMSVLWPRYHLNKRLDIIQEWARESIEEFKNTRNNDPS